MRLIHLANWKSTNVGNGALIYGTERVICEDFPEPPEFIPEPWDDYTFGLRQFDQSFVDRVNATDGLLIGGAVCFNARNYLTNTGMRFDLPLELWPKIKKPICFYGVSYRHWPGQEYPHLDKLHQVMDYMICKDNILIAVRNDGTKEWLEDTVRCGSSNIREIPDPALYVPTIEIKHRELARDRRNIVIALNGEDAPWRFENIDRSFLLEELAQIVDPNANLILSPHSLDDFEIIQDFLYMLPLSMAHQQTVTTGLTRAIHAREFYDLYRKVDLVIAMRVHAMSPAMGLGTPVRVISTQKRMDEFLRKTDMTTVRDQTRAFNQRVYDLFSH